MLASPAFKVKLYVPFARPGLKLLKALRGNFFVNSYVKPRLLTHDPERVASYVADPLISRPISVTMLLGLYEAADRVVADAQAIQLPTQLLVSGADLVVERKPQELFFQRLGSARKELHVLPGFSMTPSASGIAPMPWRGSAASSSTALPRQWRRPRCSMPTRPAPAAPKPKAWRRHCRATRLAICTGAPPALACV